MPAVAFRADGPKPNEIVPFIIADAAQATIHVQ
jgi:hypothetical protein